MSRRRSLVITLVTLFSLAVSASTAQAASCSGNTWYGPGGSASSGKSGDWDTASYWSSDSVPGQTMQSQKENVCITAPGTYKVTLGSANTNGGPIVNSLAIGATSGSQKLELLGQDYRNSSNESQPGTTLTLTSASTISSSGELVVDATTGGPSNGGGPTGGNAELVVESSLTNAGQIVFEVEPAASAETYNDRLQGTLANASGGTVTVTSGKLEPVGNRSFSLTNDGDLTVASGSTLELRNGYYGRSSITNNGPVTNSGTIAVNYSEWTQSGGSISGNAVTMQNAASLIDSVGAGSFLFNNYSGAISGTIPAGQTITVQGEAYGQNSGGNGTSLELNANGSTVPVTNDGTVILDAPGTGGSSGGPAYLTDGTLENNGTVISQNEDSTWRNDLQANINNSTTGTFTLTSGNMLEENSTTMTNSGTITVAPSALWVLDGGGAFDNTAAGTLVVQIASATTYASFQLNEPGGGAFMAAGTLDPVLEGGYVPPSGQVFPLWAQGGGPFTGTFGTVANGFVGDYMQSASLVGIIYQPSGTTPTPTSPAPTTPPPGMSSLTVKSITAGKDEVRVSLSCSAGSGACPAAKIVVTVTEHLTSGKLRAVTASKAKTKTVIIAFRTSSLAAGTSRTITLSLKGAGRALLSQFHKLTAIVRVVSDGRTLKSERVTLRTSIPSKHMTKQRSTGS